MCRCNKVDEKDLVGLPKEYYDDVRNNFYHPLYFLPPVLDSIRCLLEAFSRGCYQFGDFSKSDTRDFFLGFRLCVSSNTVLVSFIAI